MLALVMPPRRTNTLASVLLGLVLAGSVLMIAGYFRPGASVLGIPLSKPAPIVPANQWSDGLREAVASKGVTDWHVTPWAELGDVRDSRQMFYRATIEGVRNGEPVTAKVELRADHGKEWRLAKWTE